MALPFTREQFFEVMAQYNACVWPMQLALTGLAVACVAALLTGHGSSRALGGSLAALWAWMAVAYHFVLRGRPELAARG
jgi:hypothetical protein